MKQIDFMKKLKKEQTIKVKIYKKNCKKTMVFILKKQPISNLKTRYFKQLTLKKSHKPKFQTF